MNRRMNLNPVLGWPKAVMTVAIGFSFLMGAGCGGEGSPDNNSSAGPLTKDEVKSFGKADRGTDYCLEFGWYGDGICDEFCPEPDPDCASSACEAGGGVCTGIHPDNCQNGTWADYQVFSCGEDLLGVGCCMPGNLEEEAE